VKAVASCVRRIYAYYCSRLDRTLSSRIRRSVKVKKKRGKKKRRGDLKLLFMKRVRGDETARDTDVRNNPVAANGGKNATVGFMIPGADKSMSAAAAAAATSSLGSQGAPKKPRISAEKKPVSAATLAAAIGEISRSAAREVSSDMTRGPGTPKNVTSDATKPKSIVSDTTTKSKSVVASNGVSSNATKPKSVTNTTKLDTSGHVPLKSALSTKPKNVMSADTTAFQRTLAVVPTKNAANASGGDRTKDTGEASGEGDGDADGGDVVDMRFDAKAHRKTVLKKRDATVKKAHTSAPKKRHAVGKGDVVKKGQEDGVGEEENEDEEDGDGTKKKKKTNEQQQSKTPRKRAAVANGTAKKKHVKRVKGALRFTLFEVEAQNRIVCNRHVMPSFVLAWQPNCERCEALKQFFLEEHAGEANIILRQVPLRPDRDVEGDNGDTEMHDAAATTAAATVASKKSPASTRNQDRLRIPIAPSAHVSHNGSHRKRDAAHDDENNDGGESSDEEDEATRKKKRRAEERERRAQKVERARQYEQRYAHHELYYLPEKDLLDQQEKKKKERQQNKKKKKKSHGNRRGDRGRDGDSAHESDEDELENGEGEEEEEDGGDEATVGGTNGEVEGVGGEEGSKIKKKKGSRVTVEDAEDAAMARYGTEVPLILPMKSGKMMVVLRNLRKEFELPYSGPPLEHQRLLSEEVANKWDFSVRREQPYFVLWEYGTGKTQGILRAIAQRPPRRLVVIGPKTILRQWSDTFEALPWGGDTQLEVLGNNEAHALAYTNPRYFEDAVVVVDEAHYYRNMRDDMVLAMNAISKANAVFLLSGSILIHDKREVRSIYHWLGRGDLFDADRMNEREFEKLLEDNVFWYSPVAHESAAANARAFPEKRHHTVAVEMSWLQSFMYVLALRSETRFGTQPTNTSRGRIYRLRRQGGRNSYQSLERRYCNMIPGDTEASPKIRAIGDAILARWRADKSRQQVVYSKFRKLGVEGLLSYIDSQLTEDEREISAPIPRTQAQRRARVPNPNSDPNCLIRKIPAATYATQKRELARTAANDATAAAAATAVTNLVGDTTRSKPAKGDVDSDRVADDATVVTTTTAADDGSGGKVSTDTKKTKKTAKSAATKTPAKAKKRKSSKTQAGGREGDSADEHSRFVVDCIIGTTRNRQEIVNKYNEGKIHLLILTDAAHQSCDLKGKHTCCMIIMEMPRAVFDREQTENRVCRFQVDGRIRFVDIYHYVSVFPQQEATDAQAQALQEWFEDRYCKGDPAGIDVARVLWDIINGRVSAGDDIVEEEEQEEEGDEPEEDAGDANAEEQPEGDEDEDELQTKASDTRETKNVAKPKTSESKSGGGGGGGGTKTPTRRMLGGSAADSDDAPYSIGKTVPMLMSGDHGKSVKDLKKLETVDVKFERMSVYHHRELMPWVRCFHRKSPFFKDRERARARLVEEARLADAKSQRKKSSSTPVSSSSSSSVSSSLSTSSSSSNSGAKSTTVRSTSQKVPSSTTAPTSSIAPGTVSLTKPSSKTVIVMASTPKPLTSARSDGARTSKKKSSKKKSGRTR
jgi:hypothetical protein